MHLTNCLTAEAQYLPPRELASIDCMRLGSRLIVACAIMVGCLIDDYAFANSTQLSASELKQLSVEDLMNVEVTSVSKTPENISAAAAAVTVVSNDDIRRSGATTVPEALRLVPGINVASENSNSWAVSSRGFSSINSEKLLVLSDTRSIYTPLFSGVFWDVQDYLMQDIDRIEVIRGPGASLWGSNAVNGVINITTKDARNTQGGYFEGAAGSEERVDAAARYGGQTDSGVYYRVFGKYVDRGDTYHPLATSSDDWHIGHVGFRADWAANAQDGFTIPGDAYSANVGHLAPSVTIIGRPGPEGELRVAESGGNVLARWQHTIDQTADFQLRIYYDRTHRNDPSYTDDLDTVDIDLQHHFEWLGRNEIVWGANYRYSANRNEGKGVFAVDPATSYDQLASTFIQDQIALADSLQLTLGSKFEHNDFSGFEVQPTGRLAWRVTPKHTLWGAISRAVRVPTRLERDIDIDVNAPGSDPQIKLLGNRDFHSEKLVADELGYRWQPLQNLYVDIAAFDNRYHDLASLEIGTPFVDPSSGTTIIPVVNRNLTKARARGIETFITFSPLNNWRLSVSHSYLDLSVDPQGDDLNRGRFIAGATPRNQFGLRSSLDLTTHVQIDAEFRHLSAIESLPEIVSGEGIAGYSEVNVRIAWRPSRQLELSLVGQNLLHNHHPEFGTPEARGEIERGVYGKIALDF